MVTVTTTVRGTPAEVFAVLADGWSYPGWVVGTSHVRAVEAAWPAVGARLFPTSGSWPVLLDGETRVEEMEPGRRLVLLVHAGGLGDARVDLSLVPDLPTGASTTVTMVEEPVSGPAQWFQNPIGDALLQRRNAETLTRLAALVERPTAPAGQEEDESP